MVQTCFTISPLLNMSYLTSVVMLSDGLNHRTEYEQCMNSMSCSPFILKVIQSYWMNHFLLVTKLLYNSDLSQPDASKSSYFCFPFWLGQDTKVSVSSTYFHVCVLDKPRESISPAQKQATRTHPAKSRRLWSGRQWKLKHAPMLKYVHISSVYSIYAYIIILSDSWCDINDLRQF